MWRSDGYDQHLCAQPLGEVEALREGCLGALGPVRSDDNRCHRSLFPFAGHDVPGRTAHTLYSSPSGWKHSSRRAVSRYYATAKAGPARAGCLRA